LRDVLTNSETSFKNRALKVGKCEKQRSVGELHIIAILADQGLLLRNKSGLFSVKFI
jgi:hypothetical protein